MASRREQKEALRRQREERERAAREAERRRRLVGYAAGGALAVVAIVIVAVVLIAGGGGGGGAQAKDEVYPSGGQLPKRQASDLQEAASAAGCTLRSVKATSRAHITDPKRRVHYSTNPPTSGTHYQFPANDGAYTKAPPDTALVHALEHGRIDIWFKPTAPKSVRATLKALFDQEQGYQLLLIPRSNMPYELAATAWGRDPQPNGTGYLMGCTRVSDRTWDALRDFIDEHRSNGPEAVP